MTSRIAPLLSERLAKMRASDVQFDSSRKCFARVGMRKRGLTKILAQLLPVPFDKLDDETEALLTRRARKSKHDPATSAIVEHFSGATMARCGTCPTAISWARRQTSSIGERVRDERNDDKVHGIVVDYQLALYVRKGRAGLFKACGASAVDPCVGTLLEQVDALGWALVATQIPLYSSTMDVATACDVLATDRATRSKLFLIEIKATRGRDNVTRGNMQYERLRGRLQRTTLRGMPLSFYSRHQLQLWCMDAMVREAHDFTFDGAVVLRVSPGIVRRYPLNNYYHERAARIMRAIGLKTGVVGKRAKARRAILPQFSGVRAPRKRKAPGAATPRKTARKK
jgi:hypothetical protein